MRTFVLVKMLNEKNTYSSKTQIVYFLDRDLGHMREAAGEISIFFFLDWSINQGECM
jgi:hypothetical protein